MSGGSVRFDSNRWAVNSVYEGSALGSRERVPPSANHL
jgi:hypothetical protein